MSSKERKKQMIINVCVIILGVIIIGIIPIILYNGIKWPIEISTKAIENDGSGWLGFWGSFFGGIIGGFATLIGVLLTLHKMNEEREDERKKERAKIIPINSNIKAEKKNSENTLLEESYSVVSIKTNNFERKTDDSIYLPWGIISFCNVGLENALDVRIDWSQPNVGEIDSRLKSYLEEYNNKCIADDKNDLNGNIQCITYSQSNNEKYINIDKPMLKWINYLLCYFEKLNNKEQKEVWLDFGTIKITYKNVYGDTYKDTYNINSKMYCGGAGLYYFNVYFEDNIK
ncbi:MAG: hypothetical protein E7J99_09445 [Clostridium butyricum]|uniref:hypothetical protein n=1 Tax=Clostridium sp. TaxID=1506 RepID=UPI00290276C1|nr:hypothetical protein [Clostridium sp.]MDU1116025.1 hypothetical protein [Clostridium sp.]MDU7712368.1 hypothetical protein [Clostridium butyricum]